MTGPQLILYHYPGACSSVSLCALEAAQLDYRVELVDIMSGAQTTPEYAAILPLGKVPLLLIDGEPLSENSAILTYIDALRPDCGLFPADRSARIWAESMRGLSFCSGTLHPQIRGIANPAGVTEGDFEPVRARSRALLAKSFAYAERRLADHAWWLGERSIIDVYLDWALTVARRAGFDLSPFPMADGLGERLAHWPAYGRMQAEKARSRSALGL